MTHPSGHKPEQHPGMLRLIAAFKLLKAALLILAGIGALGLMHRDVHAIAIQWIEWLHLNPEQRLIHRALLDLPGISTAKMEFLGAGMLLYSSLFLTEGIGLALCRRWAEYLTIITTGLLLPLEAYELIQRPTSLRAIVLLINVAVVVYLIYRMRHREAE